MPFLNIAIGILQRTKMNFLQLDFRKRCPAKSAVMKRAKPDRIPLHCFATSMLTLGRLKANPSLTKGTPEIINSKLVNSVDPTCKK
jgi:hypothetical protein